MSEERTGGIDMEETKVNAEVAKTETATAVTTEKYDKFDEVIVKFTELGVTRGIAEYFANDYGVESVEDLALLEVEDLVKGGLKLVQARKIYAELHPAVEKPEPAAAPVQIQQQEARIAAFAQMDALLPQVPSDESWISALKIGGVKKVDDSSTIAAVKASIANRVGLFRLNERLLAEMEKFAEETDEQVPIEFFAIRKQMTRHNYAEIFEAIDGLDGTFVSKARVNKFFENVDGYLWKALGDTYRALDAWEQTRRANITDPSMIFAMFSGAGAGLMTAPDTAPLHDAGDTLIDAVNHVFRGTGNQIAAALAVDAQNIRKTLENPQLPALVGAPNREVMLRKLGANVSSNYVRLEQNLVKYTMAFLKHETVTSDVEVNYFVALWQLGSQINWAELGVSTSGGSGGSKLTGLTGKEL